MADQKHNNNAQQQSSHNDAVDLLHREVRASNLVLPEIEWTSHNATTPGSNTAPPANTKSLSPPPSWPPLKAGGCSMRVAVTLPNTNDPHQEGAFETIVVIGGGSGPGTTSVQWLPGSPSTAPDDGGNAWQPKWLTGPSMSHKRQGHAAVVCNEHVYVMGGVGLDSIELIPIKAFDRRSYLTNWVVMSCRLTCKRWGCSAVAILNRYVVVMGGYDLASVDLLDTRTNTVVPGPEMRLGRCFFGAAVLEHKNQIWVSGGCKGYNGETYDSLESIEFHGSSPPFFSASKWALYDEYSFYDKMRLRKPRCEHSMVAVGDCLIVAGGRKSPQSEAVPFVEVVDTERRLVWRLPDLTIPRTRMAMVRIADEYLLVLGGETNKLESLPLYNENTLCEKLYRQALAKGSQPPNQLRVMVCGSYGVGKTNCVRSLRNLEFNPVYESTEGIDANAGRIEQHCIRQNSVEPQDQTNLQQDETNHDFRRGLRWYLQQTPLKFHGRTNRKNQQDEDDSEWDTSIQHPEADHRAEPVQQKPAQTAPKSRLNFLWPKWQAAKSPSRRGGSEAKREKVEKFQKQNRHLETLPEPFRDDMRQAQNSPHVNKRSDDLQIGDLTLTLWDFAGQVQYQGMHQIFFREYCLYMLVMNLQYDKDRDEQVGKEEEMIRDAQLWLNAIVSSAGPHVGLLVVGTHADDDAFDSKADAEERLKSLLEELRSRASSTDWEHALKNAHTAVVDNKSGKWINELRQTLFKCSESLLHGMKEVPLRWLRLGDKLKQMPLESDRFCLPLDKAREVAMTLSFTTGDGLTDVKAALSFLDRMGKLIYVKENGLDHWVFPHPQKLLMVLKSLFAPFVTKKEPVEWNSNEWQDYVNKGLLNTNALTSLWRHFEDHAQLRSLLAQCGIILDLGDHVVVPSLLPNNEKTLPQLPYRQEDGVHMDMKVQTVCGTHLPYSLFPYVLARFHRELGRPDQTLELMGRIHSVLILNHQNEKLARHSINVKLCYLLLEADQLQHPISLTVRTVCWDGREHKETTVAICIEVVKLLHKITKQRYGWMELRSWVSTIKPCNGLTHDWCMLETTPAKGTLKLSASCPKVCVVTGEHTLLDTVSDVSQQAFERQDGMETLISRADEEIEDFREGRWGILEARWDPDRCPLAKVENQLVSRTADLYGRLLRVNGNHFVGDKTAEDSISFDQNNASGIMEQEDLLQRAVKKLLEVYVCLANVETLDHPIDTHIEHSVFLSHRGEEDIKSYVARLWELLQKAHACSAFFDRKSLAPGDIAETKMIRTAMSCQIGVVTLIRGYFTSKWCLREFGIFSARNKLQNRRLETSSPGSLPRTFVLVADAFENEAIDLCLPGTRRKLPKWDIPQAVRRERDLSYEHASQVVDAIINRKTMLDAQIRCPADTRTTKADGSYIPPTWQPDQPWTHASPNNATPGEVEGGYFLPERPMSGPFQLENWSLDNQPSKSLIEDPWPTGIDANVSSSPLQGKSPLASVASEFSATHPRKAEFVPPVHQPPTDWFPPATADAVDREGVQTGNLSPPDQPVFVDDIDTSRNISQAILASVPMGQPEPPAETASHAPYPAELSLPIRHLEIKETCLLPAQQVSSSLDADSAHSTPSKRTLGSSSLTTMTETAERDEDKYQPDRFTLPQRLEKVEGVFGAAPNTNKIVERMTWLEEQYGLDGTNLKPLERMQKLEERLQ